MEKKAFTKKNPNYLYSILSVALVLFLLGFFSLFLMHATKWVKEYKEHVNVMVEVKEGTGEKEIYKLMNRLEGMPYIKEATIEFLSKESVGEEMKKELGTIDDKTIGIANPFYDMINFNLKADYMNADSLELIRKIILRNEMVKDVFYQELLVDQINANLRKIIGAALFLGLFFVIIAVVLIHNTIRLAMYANRFLIKNMQLVGATWEFISRPYLNRSLVNGLWSGTIAIVLLLILVFALNLQFTELRLDIWLEDILGIFLVMLGIILLGVVITFGSTYYVVNKYLKMRLDDLY